MLCTAFRSLAVPFIIIYHNIFDPSVASWWLQHGNDVCIGRMPLWPKLQSWSRLVIVKRFFQGRWGYTSQFEVPFEWKLVIVDNGSTEKIRDIIKHFQSRLKIELLFVRRDS